MLFLFPLMLQAYKDLPYHAMLRGAIDGITPSQANAILSSRRDRMRKGVLANVSLHARLESRYADVGGREIKREMSLAGFGKELLDANLRKLEKVVRGLRWSAGDTAWTRYGEDNTYDDASAAVKAAFVREAAARRRVASPGTSAATTARIPGSRRSSRTLWLPSTRTMPPSMRSTARFARSSARTFSPW